LQEFFDDKAGLSHKSKNQFVKRFELYFYTLLKNKNKTFIDFTKLNQRKIINMYLSRLNSINYDISEIIKYNFIRLYLIKTFRGRCHALGKPSRGQRT
jgi:ribosomal protein S13